MMDPTPTNGKPYYCALCGLGFGEFLVCEQPNCKLESEAAAKKRAKEAAKKRAKEARRG